MSAHDRECILLFDAAAEALVLVCPTEQSTVDELMERLEAIAEWFGDDVDDAHPASLALRAAERFAAGDASAVAQLEAAFTDARSRALKGPAKRATEEPAPKTRPKKPAKSAGPKSASAAETAPAAAVAAAPMPLAGDAELLRDFGIRAAEHMDDADAQLLVLEAKPTDPDAVNAVFRAFHTIKGMAGFLALDDISEHSHASENLLTDARATASAVRPDEIQALFSAVDRMRELVAEHTGIGGSLKAEEPKSAKSADDPTRAGLMTPGAVSSGARTGTIRVDESRLDRLLDAIGELVIAESMVSSSTRIGEAAGALELQVERLDKITRELQSMATSLRMVPLKATFQRMSRLVRDLSHRSGKPIELILEGEDTELDKVVVDQLSDPLVHALRNAVDHGIESPAERAAAGKPETGTVYLRAYHAGGAIHIEIADDGRGLDPDRILATARERGLITTGDTVDAAAITELVFAPGFSTAEEVTDVSGRGVGMDVVRRTIEDLRGRIELTSRPGEGTTLSVRLPITLAIIDGMVARVGDERYVIPMLSIERSVRPAAGQITTVAGRGEMLTLPEGMLPVLRLHRLFSVQGAQTDPTQGVIIITSENGVRAGLLACELLGQQQTVIKPLGDGLLEQPGITGGAIMPDGRVGLILDAAGLIRVAHEEGGA